MSSARNRVLREQRAVRVQSSARRGSSWPIIVDTENGSYFTKLAGSGHGTAALVAEVVVAELAEAIGLHVPPRALINIDPQLHSDNSDPELLDLLRASQGLNVGLELLAGARDFRPADIERVDPDDAARIVWLDWLVMNPDRSISNPNLLWRADELWLVDHGSALIFHHNWPGVTEDSPARPWFSLSKHVLLSRATELAEWHPVLSAQLDRDVLRDALRQVPEEFLRPLLTAPASPAALHRRREAYIAFLWKRMRTAPRVSH